MKRRLIIGLVAGVLAALVVAELWDQPEDPWRAADEAARAPAEAASDAPGRVGSEGQARTDAKARPARKAYALRRDGDGPIGAEEAARAAAQENAGPRGGVDEGVIWTETSRDEAMEAAIDPMLGCLRRWSGVAQVPQGRIDLAVTVTPEGLEGVEILELDDVPAAVSSCVTDALQDVMWPMPDGQHRFETSVWVSVE